MTMKFPNIHRTSVLECLFDEVTGLQHRCFPSEAAVQINVFRNFPIFTGNICVGVRF